MVLITATLVEAAPRFAAYPAINATPGALATPKIVSSEERQFRTVLRRATSKGYGVVDGGTEYERRGPNFAGNIVLVQWGCGSNCMRAALIDTRDGTVFSLPDLPNQKTHSEFTTPTGSADLRTLQFRTDSRLLGAPNIEDGKTYYLALVNHGWKPITSNSDPEAFR